MKTFGLPTEENFPGWKNLKYSKTLNFNRYPPTKFSDKFKKDAISENGIKLIKEMLHYDSNKRITASKALKHEWFKESPMCPLEEMPRI